MQEPTHGYGWLGNAAESGCPRGIPNHVLLSVPRSKQKGNLLPSSLTELGDFTVPIDHRGRKRESSSRRRSRGGQLSAPTHDLVFQTTSLHFFHATQGFEREATETAGPPKG